MKLYVDSDCVRTETVIEHGVPVVRAWKGACTVLIAIMHLSSGQVEEMSLSSVMYVCSRCELDTGGVLGADRTSDCMHSGEMPRDLVTWMIAKGVWPRTRPVVHGPEGDEALLLRDLIDAYWRPRADLEAAPKWVVWATYEAAGDGAEVMGWYTPQEAAAAFARGRWRLVGCPPAMLLTVMDEKGVERRFTVVCGVGTFVPTEVEA